MSGDAASAARLRAYSLIEAAQGHDHAAALDELLALEAEALEHGWDDVAFVALAGQAVCAIVRSQDPDQLAQRLDALVVRGHAVGAPELVALGFALRAVGASARQDSAAVLADAGRAVALVDDDELPALDRCSVLVICAAAYNGLSLWELVYELYEQETLLEPRCAVPVQAPAVAVNRVLLLLEWATALFETGEPDEAVRHLGRAADATEVALRTPRLPELWRAGVLACRDLLAFVERAYRPPADDSWVVPDLETLARHRADLVAAEDVEMLPLLDALLALALHWLGRHEQARQAALPLGGRLSSSSGVRSFPAWVRAQVLSGTGAQEAVDAYREYAELVARSRWAARLGVLAAARSKIAGERLSVDHARLSRDVLLDPLTGLSNRRCFDDWLTQVPAHDRSTALLLVDLDSFKVVNDVHGHAVGDEVLRQVGVLLAEHVRPGDLALRLGGDEFAMVLQDDRRVPRPEGSEDAFARTARARADSLRVAVAETDWSAVSPGLTVRISVGVGVATLGPTGRDAADLLYREADADLYAAKAQERLARS
ncbi:MAG: diguanylate cyclase domain-containing protein [Nocardioidaceae bacterium]